MTFWTPLSSVVALEPRKTGFQAILCWFCWGLAWWSSYGQESWAEESRCSHSACVKGYYSPQVFAADTLSSAGWRYSYRQTVSHFGRSICSSGSPTNYSLTVNTAHFSFCAPSPWFRFSFAIFCRNCCAGVSADKSCSRRATSRRSSAVLAIRTVWSRAGASPSSPEQVGSIFRTFLLISLCRAERTPAHEFQEWVARFCPRHLFTWRE